MTLSASTLRKLMDAGVNGEVLLDIVAAIEADVKPARSSAAERQKRYRDKQRDITNNVTGDATSDVTAVSPKEIPPTPPKEITPSRSEAKASSRDIRAALGRVLDAEHVEAVIDHRRAKRSPLTLKAAELLARDLADGDANDNADEMIRRGWTGFKAGWRRESATGPPRQQSQNGFAALTRKLHEEINGQPHGSQHEEPATPGAADPDPTTGSGFAPQRGDPRGDGTGSASGQGDQRGRTPRHGGPVIDLEAVPRPARPQGH